MGLEEQKCIWQVKCVWKMVFKLQGLKLQVWKNRNAYDKWDVYGRWYLSFIVWKGLFRKIE